MTPDRVVPATDAVTQREHGWFRHHDVPVTAAAPPASAWPPRRPRVEVPLAAALLVAHQADPARALEPGAHAFLHERADGTPVTWDPCSPIGYVVNWDHAPTAPCSC